MTDNFEPKILGFLCNWCSYAGADLAGVSRIQYPSNIRTIRVMCSGTVDPAHVLEALQKGIDGVIITGCHIGDCHYQTGNHQTLRRYNALHQVLGYTSFGTDRIRLEWVSASEGIRFGDVISDFTEHIKKLGPNPVKSNDHMMKELEAVRGVFDEHCNRTLLGKEGELVEQGNVYGEKVDKDTYEDYVSESVRKGYIRNYVLVSSKGNLSTVKELAKELDVEPSVVLEEVSTLLRSNLLAIEKIEGTTPKFVALAQEVES